MTVLRRGKLLPRKGSNAGGGNGESSLSYLLNRLFQEAYLRLCFSVKSMAPCQVLGLTHNVNILEEGQVEILISALVHKTAPMLTLLRPPGRSRSTSVESQNLWGTPTPREAFLVTNESRHNSTASK